MEIPKKLMLGFIFAATAYNGTFPTLGKDACDMTRRESANRYVKRHRENAFGVKKSPDASGSKETN